MIILNSEERIYLIKRRHPITLKCQLLPLIFLQILILSLLLFFLLGKGNWIEDLNKDFPFFSNWNLRAFLLFTLSLILPPLWALFFYLLISYYLTYWVITNQRIIFVRLKGLFNLEYVSLSYDKIQDISLYVKGMLASFFHFGDIRIQTASESGQFYFNSIPDVEIVKQVILEAQTDFLRKTHAKSSN